MSSTLSYVFYHQPRSACMRGCHKLNKQERQGVFVVKVISDS